MAINVIHQERLNTLLNSYVKKNPFTMRIFNLLTMLCYIIALTNVHMYMCIEIYSYNRPLSQPYPPQFKINVIFHILKIIAKTQRPTATVIFTPVAAVRYSSTARRPTKSNFIDHIRLKVIEIFIFVFIFASMPF